MALPSTKECRCGVHLIAVTHGTQGKNSVYLMKKAAKHMLGSDNL